jgi:glucose-1-phosphate cytidylyltransferase|tara:strand:+ start:1307 stop:2044 length:738 start_codon:yes stop_codon:yes gene_type:complete
MKVIILAGGFGSRLSEYTKLIPKPMVKVNSYPLLIHIMQIYIKHNIKDFIIAAGYKSHVIKNYFKNFKKSGKNFSCKISGKECNVVIVDTGLNSLTGGRIKRASKYLSNSDEDFMFTYGDGVSDINISKLQRFHKKTKKIITVTAVRPPARFGEIRMKKNLVYSFKEKPQVTDGWINGGFFVAKKSFLKLIRGDKEILEKYPLERSAKNKQLSAYKHKGFWKCVDTKRDKDELDKILKKNLIKYK